MTPLSNKAGRAHLLGGGIGSLAAAAFLIRDAGMAGHDISILEAAPRMGGNLDAAGDHERGHSMRGGRMLTTDPYECTWDLFRSIPSLRHPGRSVFDETVEFNERHRSCAMARLVDRRRAGTPAASTGFSMQDRLDLLRLSHAQESELGSRCLTDCLSPAFFETGFWRMWSSTFAFQPWHGAVEFRRYLHRFLLEFSRIGTLAGVRRAVYDPHDSLVLPLQCWLQSQGVRMIDHCTVTELAHESREGGLVITGIHCELRGRPRLLRVDDGDLVFLQNGSMTDASSVGSMTRAPAHLTQADSTSWAVWEKLAQGRPAFGNPAAFKRCLVPSYWQSFTVTLRGTAFLEQMQRFTGNEADTDALVTFKDSNWLMSIVPAHPPHPAHPPADVQVFWGHALFPDQIGNHVPKAMADCSGAEILQELCGHLHLDPATVEDAHCIPCRMPYLTSRFMPRGPGGRPLPVPAGSRNFAFISQFVEAPEDVVFTVEHSVRAARAAVHQLTGVQRAMPPVMPHERSLHAQFDALIQALA